MTEEFLRELGLNDETVRAILEQVQEHDAKQNAVYDGMLKKERASRLREMLERAGIKEGTAYRAVMDELWAAQERGEDASEHLMRLRIREPELFACPVPYFAAALEEEGAGDKAPFRPIRPRTGGGR